MAVAALILGIVSLLISFIPFCGIFATVPAIVGIILGAISVNKASKENSPKGMAMSGLIMSIVAIVIILFWYFVAGVAISNTDLDDFDYEYNDYYLD